MSRSADYYLGKIEAIIEVTDMNVEQAGPDSDSSILLRQGAYEHIRKIIQESKKDEIGDANGQ